MKSVKDKGKKELESFFNRLTRSYGMDRINEDDFNFLHDRAKKMLEHIEKMEEKDGE